MRDQRVSLSQIGQRLRWKCDNNIWDIANWKDMGNIYVQNCSATEVAQKWNVMKDGRIALIASSPRKFLFHSGIFGLEE